MDRMFTMLMMENTLRTKARMQSFMTRCRSGPLPAQYYFMKDARYESSRLYTFANMAHQEIFELGCNYEQCRDDFGGIGEAVFTCVYNKKAPKKTDLYQKGDKTGCASGAKVKDVCKMKDSKCGGLLCELPRDPKAPYLFFMAHQEIFELGCNYEQCRDDFGGIGEAVFTCVYNKKAPKKTDLYQKGDKTGCASGAKVKDVCKMKDSKCGGLLCELATRS
ncbi:hypothetical protein OSTOST_02859 [Ostertagia ostertagi]